MRAKFAVLVTGECCLTNKFVSMKYWINQAAILYEKGHIMFNWSINGKVTM